MDTTTKESLLKHERMIPRYTSYPTAPHFRSGPSDGWYEGQLERIPPCASLSLYIHVPFCPRLCWFCGCHTRIVNRYGPVEEYLSLVRREFSMIWPYLKSKNLKVTHLHFGGGSPTILKNADFSGFIGMLSDHFDFNAIKEIAIEVDPRNVSEDNFKAYRMAGVNRASFGIQDFDHRVMTAINRVQPYELDRDVISMCRDQGIGSINIDLMYGLPYQNNGTMNDAAEKTLSLDPDRIALFGYAHVPWLKKHMRLLPEDKLPPPEARIDLFEQAAAAFEDSGYISIGIDHFSKTTDNLAKAARDNSLNRNFQGYTDDNSPYLLALGASAISCVNSVYAQSEPYLPQYRERIQSGSIPVSRFYESTPEDKLRSRIIKTMMCDLMVNPFSEERNLGMEDHDFDGCYESLHILADDGLVKISQDGTVHAMVRQAARLVAACFDQKIAYGVGRHATST